MRAYSFGFPDNDGPDGVEIVAGFEATTSGAADLLARVDQEPIDAIVLPWKDATPGTAYGRLLLLVFHHLRRRLVPVVDEDGVEVNGDDKRHHQILAALDAHHVLEVAVKGRRIKTGKDASRERGRHVDGPLPYGRDDAERLVVERMKAARAAGKSLREIAKDLNDSGIKTNRGNEWSPQAVKNVIDRQETRP